MEEYKATHPPGARTDTPPSEPAPAQAAAAPTEAPAPAAAPAESAPAPGESPQANTDKGAVPPAAAPLTSPQASALGAAAATPPPTPPTPPAEESAPAKTAAQEKRDCQVFLDRGANGKAIAAGERSVALDPSDGEAWLLLGGAYQVTGRAGDAKRAFNSCVKQGKRGPIADCKSMLQ
jgi:hypothetical protein